MDFKILTVDKSPSSQVLSLLNSNIIGTPGRGMLYQHLGVRNKINHIANPFYVNLGINDKVIGTSCFCSRTTHNATVPLPAFYIRYFSFKETYRRKQIVSKEKKSKDSLIRKEIHNILSGVGLERNSTEKFYHYAYVDPRNIRSLELCNEFGFEQVRKFSTIIFNRINPKQDSQVVELPYSEVGKVKILLNNFYKDYRMFSFENLFKSRKYYVIKDASNKILAGVSVNSEHWRIHSMPGITGKIILNVFSKLPILKKIFNKDYRFLTLEGIYFLPGHEKYLEVLFESLLAKYNLYSAMMWVDTNSNLYKSIKSIELGIVDKLNKEVSADVICKFANFNNEEKALFNNNPAYISGIDLT